MQLSLRLFKKKMASSLSGGPDKTDSAPAAQQLSTPAELCVSWLCSVSTVWKYWSQITINPINFTYWNCSSQCWWRIAALHLRRTTETGHTSLWRYCLWFHNPWTLNQKCNNYVLHKNFVIYICFRVDFFCNVRCVNSGCWMFVGYTMGKCPCCICEDVH